MSKPPEKHANPPGDPLRIHAPGAPSSDLLLPKIAARRDDFKQTSCNDHARIVESAGALIDKPAASCGPSARSEQSPESPDARNPADCAAGSVATDLCSKGIRLHDEGHLIAALSCLEKALQSRPTPLARSYLGVCIAAERGQVSRGIALCEEAIAADPDNPVHHLNLARILIRTGRKSEALAALRRGPGSGERSEIRTLLGQMGSRRQPLFPSLPRSHPLNRILGLILVRLHLR